MVGGGGGGGGGVSVVVVVFHSFIHSFSVNIESKISEKLKI